MGGLGSRTLSQPHTAIRAGEDDGDGPPEPGGPRCWEPSGEGELPGAPASLGCKKKPPLQKGGLFAWRKSPCGH